ncbi:MAG: hypothetical protein O7H41_19705 [Planctomycetota bacterium]|nr:hypothetical protein [Planctomycetota bacterium]
MNLHSFQKAKEFIEKDIGREIALAKATAIPAGEQSLRELGIYPGGGNFLAALGLLCYTEWAGKLKYGCKYPVRGRRGKEKDAASHNFNHFFDDLGPGYRRFREDEESEQESPYSTFRCGLAHEYLVKKSCTIYMLGGGPVDAGIGKDSAGRYWFVVERYFSDLMRALDNVEAQLFPR